MTILFILKHDYCMIRFNYIRLSIILIFCLIYSDNHAQDIFDLGNSIKYADHLFASKEYKLAANEYERVVYLDTSNVTARLRLTQSYRLNGNYSKSLNRIDDFYPSLKKMPEQFSTEYGKLLIITGEFDRSRNFLIKNETLNNNERLFLEITTELLDRKWDLDPGLLNRAENSSNPKVQDYALILNNILDLKYKSPALSFALSAAVPGLGKVYSGFWKDGLVSLVFSGISAWQSYRGFNQKGINSIYGWGFASVAMGFYLGNLYGSVKAAKKYNNRVDSKIFKSVEAVFSTYLP